MKNRFILLLGLLVALGLMGYAIFFQVRYDEYAIKTTLGGVDGPSAVKTEPGIYPQLPPPLQYVHKMPKRLQIMEDQLEEFQTVDGFSAVVRMYLVWRIEDPKAFFVKLENTDKARQQLLPMLRDLRKVVGRYRFDELVNTDASKLKLQEIEQASLAAIEEKLKDQGYGIQALQVGIRRLVLPEQVTQQVFESMKQARQTLAENARSEGKNQAEDIRSKAESAKKIILAFAENRAQAIRTLGDLEAADYYKAFQANEDLAIYLRKIETLKKVLPHNSTLILDANQIGLQEMLPPSSPSSPSPTPAAKTK